MVLCSQFLTVLFSFVFKEQFKANGLLFRFWPELRPPSGVVLLERGLGERAKAQFSTNTSPYEGTGRQEAALVLDVKLPQTQTGEGGGGCSFVAFTEASFPLSSTGGSLGPPRALAN